MAPILVENIRFIGLTSDHFASEQAGHDIPCESNDETSSTESESGFWCTFSSKWSALNADSQLLQETIRSLNSPTCPLATRTASGVSVGESTSTMSP